MVYVTLTLDPAKFDGPASIAWSAGGVHAITPRIRGTSVTCCIPHGVFAQRAAVKLQLVGGQDANQPVLAWTQIPVLGEATFRADVISGVPSLLPLGAKKAASPDPRKGTDHPFTARGGVRPGMGALSIVD